MDRWLTHLDFFSRDQFTPFVFPLPLLCKRLQSSPGEPFYEEKRYNTIRYNRTITSKIFAYLSRILIKNMMQRNELFPLSLFYFPPKIFPTILRSTDLKQTLKREKGKKKKRINFKTSYHHTTALVNIKYSKGLNNTCNQ